MMKFVISAEIFSIPYQNNYVIYAPLKRIALLVSASVVSLLEGLSGRQSEFTDEENELIDTLVNLGIINSNTNLLPRPNFGFCKPSYVTLFLTTACNLKCQYCYASGGEKPLNNMNLEIAQAAIDYIINNAIGQNKKSILIGFHGGGEPTLAWDMFQNIVQYSKKHAKEKRLNVNLTLATNGIMPPEHLDFIMDNCNGISLSIDGPQDIQNRQRPYKNGDGSFKDLMKTIEKLNKSNFSYATRVTVTSDSVHRMAEIAEFIGKTCKVKRVQFDPVFSCGRCSSSGIDAPSNNDFINGFREAYEVLQKIGITAVYSGARLDTITTYFCKAIVDSFCVTPEGDITSCFEVCSRDDSRSEIFYYGKWDKDQNTFIINQGKIDYLRKRTIENIAYCEDCFCKYHCAGDCAAKALNANDILSVPNLERCEINRALTLDQILRVFKLI